MRRTRRWTDARIREELKDFLAGYDEWPPYSEFARAGRKALRDAVTASGGARLWAERMRVRYTERKPGYAPLWTEERVRAELTGFLEGRTQWPSRADFERAGRKPLRDALQRLGGVDRWAAEFGLVRTDRRAGSRRVYTDEAIELELRRLARRVGGWPTRTEFADAGLWSMRTAIYVYRGAAYWAERIGVDPPLPRPRAAKWSDARIRQALGEFCRGRESWPPQREFESAGLGTLYRAASRAGGVGRWADELGLRR